MGVLIAFTPVKSAFKENSSITKHASPGTFKIININTATVNEIDKLPMIGPSKAKAIIDYREKIGPFEQASDLLNVKGIGKSTLDKISALITGFSSNTNKIEKLKAKKININTAILAEIETLPSIGEIKAREIIKYREAHGPFRELKDLLNVKGIGSKTIEKMKDMIEF
jgi:competence protein ComEA